MAIVSALTAFFPPSMTALPPPSRSCTVDHLIKLPCLLIIEQGPDLFAQVRAGLAALGTIFARAFAHALAMGGKQILDFGLLQVRQFETLGQARDGIGMIVGKRVAGHQQAAGNGQGKRQLLNYGGVSFHLLLLRYRVESLRHGQSS